MAAKISGVPIVIHEQNAVAGLSNRQLSRWAKRVLYAFPKAFQHEGGLVGNPVRADIAALPVPEERFETVRPSESFGGGRAVWVRMC